MKRLLFIPLMLLFIPTHPQGQDTTDKSDDPGRVEKDIAENLRDIDSLKHERDFNNKWLKYQHKRDSINAVQDTANNTMPSN